MSWFRPPIPDSMKTHAIHAILTNDIGLNRAALGDDLERFRVGEPGGAVGWGLGTVQDGRALVKRRPRLGNHVFDFAALVGDAPSRVVIGVVVAGHGAALRTEAIPPFRFQSWLLAGYPDGSEPLTPAARTAVRALVPPHLVHSMEGDSDAEWLLYAAFSGVAVHPSGRKADIPARLTGRLLREAHASLASRLPEAVATDTIVSNGRVLAALASSRPMYWRQSVGLEDDPMERDRRRAMALAPRATSRPHFRALALTTEPDGGTDWNTLAPGALLTYSPVDGVEIDVLG